MGDSAQIGIAYFAINRAWIARFFWSLVLGCSSNCSIRSRGLRNCWICRLVHFGKAEHDWRQGAASLKWRCIANCYLFSFVIHMYVFLCVCVCMYFAPLYLRTSRYKNAVIIIITMYAFMFWVYAW